MTDERLIEEAKAGLEAFDAYWGDGCPVTPAYGRPWEIIRRLLAVFEKALGEATVTPTDDEREALARAIGDSEVGGRSAWGPDFADPSWEFMRDFDRRTADAVLAAGFRRSEPEPSAECPQCGVRVTDQTPSTFYARQEESCGGPLEEPQGEPSSEVPDSSAERQLTPCGNLVCTGCRVCGCPALGIEPQGEASDAPRPVLLHIKGESGTFCGVQNPSHVTDGPRYADCAECLAALRAASEAGGEGR